MGSFSAIHLLLAAVLLSSGCAAGLPLSPIDAVESRSISANPALANYLVTVHVLLQIHDYPDEQKRATQDVKQIAACQENIVATALRLAEGGARAIVAEGFYAIGSLAKPMPVRAAQLPATSIANAKWLLASRSDVEVFGFEVKPLNEFGVAVVRQLGASAAKARELAKDGYEALTQESKDEHGRLVQDEFTRLNLWYAGIMTERSFLALETALAVALARRDNQVQLLIGKQHWADLVYAVNRHDDVRLRLVPYPCE